MRDSRFWDALPVEATIERAAINWQEEWCYEHMVEKLDCVHCQFGDENLIFMFECPRCAFPHNAKTWGWRSPDGQELCIRCMAIGAYQSIRTHELLMPQFPNNARI